MKDFLPILIAIIWLGYKYYQKNQKKIEEERLKTQVRETHEEKPQANPQAEKEVKSLDDFMTSFFGNQQEEIIKATVNQPPQYTSVEDNYSEIEDNYSEIEDYSSNTKPIDSAEDWTNSIEDSVEKTNIRAHQKALLKKNLEEEESYNIDNENIMKDFDIEKAIIYNAILNRPYS